MSPCSRGDLVSLLIGPRDGNHACDLTAVDLTLAGGGREWNLAREVSPDVLAGNPHADAHGNAGVWHFYTEPDKGGSGERVIPAGSLLARWQSAATADERQRLAQELEALLEVGSAGGERQSGRRCCTASSRRCADRWSSAVRLEETGKAPASRSGRSRNSRRSVWPRALFGKHPNGTAIDTASLCVRAPRCWRFACRPTWSRAASL